MTASELLMSTGVRQSETVTYFNAGGRDFLITMKGQEALLSRGTKFIGKYNSYTAAVECAVHIIDRTEKIRLVVVDEHTLGYIFPETPASVSILRSMITKGAPFSLHDDAISAVGRKVRLATKRDFEEYRHCSKGYFNTDEYEHA